MNKKNVGALLLVVATALGGPVAVQIGIDEQEVESVEIIGPNNAEVGELVHLQLIGQRTSWKLPITDTYRIDDNNVVLSFREPGEYVVIASAVAGRRTSIVEHVITVLGPPEPDPIVTSTLTDLVYQWCVDAEAPTASIEKLGYNFLAASQQDSIETILAFVASANREVSQVGCEDVLTRIQQHLFDQLSGKGVAAHQLAFAQIGEGLLKYTR